MKRLSVIGYWLLVAGCSFLFSCGEKVEQPTMTDEKITRVMADLYIADAATNGLSGYAKDSLAQVYFKQVLEMHGTTKEEYEKNLRLIANDLPRMEAVVKGAEEILNAGGGEKKKEEKAEEESN
jgi:hypothetical protein